MDKTTALGIIKAIAAVLAVFGVVVTDIQVENITVGWMTVHSIASVIQAKFTKTDDGG